MMAQQWMLRHFLVESFLCRATDAPSLSVRAPNMSGIFLKRLGVRDIPRLKKSTL
jgi:hypothetical protein